MTKFEKVIRQIIKKSNGKLNDFNLEVYAEQLSHAFAFAPENYWMGIRIMKNPLDLAILQQIIFNNRPDTIIECGTAYGGSALFLAQMFELMKINGKIISIDKEPLVESNFYKKEIKKIDKKIVSLHIEESKTFKHENITFITADCLKAEIPKINIGKKVMVILDCHHSGEHVFKELKKFSRYVTPGQYLIVEDTDYKPYGNGPKSAIKKFLKDDGTFFVDNYYEKFGITSNKGGYLIKT